MTEYSCSICSYISTRKEHVINHINKKKKCGEGIADIITIPNEIKCDTCDNKFTSTISLNLHKNKFCKNIYKDLKIDFEKEFNNLQIEHEKLKNTEKEFNNLQIEYEKLKEKLKETQIKPKEKYKQKLSTVLRFAVWNNTIGQKVAVHKCLCCNSNEISQQNFQCGHVISRFNGGEDVIDNLVPICGTCNGSMGTADMDSFMKTLTPSV